jgi:hypothetical protein
VALLDRLPDMDVGARTANDQILMYIVSLCVLQERFGLGSDSVQCSVFSDQLAAASAE